MLTKSSPIGQKVRWSEKQWRLWWSVVVAVGKKKCRSALSTIWASAGLPVWVQGPEACPSFALIFSYPYFPMALFGILQDCAYELLSFSRICFVGPYYAFYSTRMVWGYSQSQIVSIPVFQGRELSSTHWVLLNCCPSLSPFPLKALRNVCIQIF